MEIQATRNTIWCGSTSENTRTAKDDKTLASKASFSHMLRQLETGGGIRDTDDNSGEDTTVVTQVMSDGSVLTTVYEGDRIVSQSKTHAAHPEDNPTILSTQVEKSGKIGTDETEKLASAETAALMLNMLQSR